MKTEEISEAISAAITSGKLPPGCKLNERDLALVFDVSRTIIRQALGRLQQESLVVISPKRATTVVKPSIEEAHQLFEAIGMLESAVLDRLGKLDAKKYIPALRKHVDSENRAAKAGQVKKANQLGREFHTLLVSFVGNVFIEKAHAQLIKQQGLITALFKTQFEYDVLQDEHSKVVDCLEKGDVAGAKAVLASHYRLVILGYQFKDGEAGEVDTQAIFG